MSLAIGYKTHPGKRRENNEDSYAVLRKSDLAGHLDALVVVADGMGGTKGGEIASSITVETMPQVVSQLLARTPDKKPNASALLLSGIQAANSKIFERNQVDSRPVEMSMGTTCVGAIVQGGHATILNIGDSRAYILKRTGKMLQVTEDHSHVWIQVQAGLMTREEARVNRHRNILMRVVGIEEEVEGDVFEIDLEAGDTLLLCSDGLSTEVEDRDIGRVLASASTVQEACDRLVEAALEGGGSDNITVIVVRYGTFTPIPVGNVTDEDETTADTDDWRRNTAAFKPITLDTEPESHISLESKSIPSPVVMKRGISPALAFLIFVIGLVSGGGGAAYFVKQRADHEREAYVKEHTPAPIIERTTLPLFYGMPDLLVNNTVRPDFLQVGGDGNPIVAVANGRLMHLVKKKGLQQISGLPTLGSSTTDATLSTTPPTRRRRNQPDSTKIDVPATPSSVVAYDLSGNRYQSDPKTKSLWKFDAKGIRVNFDIGKPKVTAPSVIAIARSGDIYYIAGGHLYRISAYENEKEVPPAEPIKASAVSAGAPNSGN